MKLLLIPIIAAAAIVGALLYPTVHAPTVADQPTATECVTYGPGNLLDHWTKGVVIDTCAPGTRGYDETVALLAYNATH